MGRILSNKKQFITLVIITLITLSVLSFQDPGKHSPAAYKGLFVKNLLACRQNGRELLDLIKQEDISGEPGKKKILTKITDARLGLKAADFWLRYLQPTAYLRINGQLPVEWETEVFEKFEKPYKRIGAGLTLAVALIAAKLGRAGVAVGGHPALDAAAGVLQAVLLGGAAGLAVVIAAADDAAAGAAHRGLGGAGVDRGADCTLGSDAHADAI